MFINALRSVRPRGRPLNAVSISLPMYLTANAKFQTTPPPVSDMPLTACTHFVENTNPFFPKMASKIACD